MANTFETLNAVNVNGHTEKKNNLTYLSWAWAWAEVKKLYPDATYEIERFGDCHVSTPYLYDSRTGYMVFTKVTIGGLTHEMWLPVMDGANKAMKAEPYTYTVKNPKFRFAKLNKEDGKYYDSYGNEQVEYQEKVCEAATMFDVNKAIMRCLVKNLAMFGLGLYIYAGEDLPETEQGPDMSAPITEIEQASLEALCKKTYPNHPIEQIFPSWPKLTKAQYVEAIETIKKKAGN